MDVMFTIRNVWNKLIEHKAHPDDEALRRVLKATLYAYYEPIARPVVIDKCRGWLSLIEMAEWALQCKVKILCPVRDIRDVLASFEKLWRGQASQGQIATEQENYFAFQCVEGRVEHWLRDSQPVGLAVNRIRDAIARGYRDRIHFVRFEELTSQPKKTLSAVYEFLGEQPFEHNFDNVEQVTQEDDVVHGFKGLHDIRAKVEAMPSKWKSVLGEFAGKYTHINNTWK
jgi:sulfotransferase